MPQGLIHQLVLLQHGIVGRKSERTCFLKLFKRSVALGVHARTSITYTSTDSTRQLYPNICEKRFLDFKKPSFSQLGYIDNSSQMYGQM